MLLTFNNEVVGIFCSSCSSTSHSSPTMEFRESYFRRIVMRITQMRNIGVVSSLVLLPRNVRRGIDCLSLTTFSTPSPYYNQISHTMHPPPPPSRRCIFAIKGYVSLVTEKMLELNGQKLIIIVGGANMRGWPEKMIDDELEIVRDAGVVQLQREISDSTNIQAVKSSS
ncbi:hypothetical protein Rs2_41950 [Raphanus sativus]|nr:hypothetical protein Rs2_41950 [Raphanus sativus]